MNLNSMSSFPRINVVYSPVNMPQLDSPYLICGFPGTGYVGKIAIDHLIQELDAKRLADIFSTSFPPQIMIRTDGVAELMKNTIFYSKSASNDLLLLTGDSQPISPESEYLLAEEILDIAAKFNAKKVFTLAASVTGVFVDKPRVFGTATDSDIVKTFPEKNILTMDGGIIAGMNGLIIGIAKLRGMQGTCLLGETSGYVVDAKASKSILESLLSIVQIMVDMTNLETKA
ncbi:MAG TPA: proteasome assembly chaperone family protein, partial [Methanosarcina sp.]|nr:proteasome assembly chaperone family protein [Methanosarcina sp.]